MLSLSVLKIVQRDFDLYITAMKAHDLLRYGKVDWWREENPEGYQRPLSEARIRKAARYLLDEDGLFPTNILINVRGETEFIPASPIGDFCELGVLRIPQQSLPFWIIDGQHRLIAIKLASQEDPRLTNYTLPVSLLTLKSRFDEMRLFYIVNSRQKSVPTALAQIHLHRTIKERGEERVFPFETKKRALAAIAIDVVDVLRTHTQSPWYERVQLPSEPKSSNHIITLTSFADSIGHILGKLSRIERDQIREDPNPFAECLMNYWRALRAIYPAAFDSPLEYSLQKTYGCYIFHNIFPDIYKLWRASGDLTEEKIKDILIQMLNNFSKDIGANALDSEFWNSRTGHVLARGGGMKMVRDVVNLFKRALSFQSYPTDRNL